MTLTSMTKKQVAEVLVFLNDAYPNFTVTQSKIDNWHRLLKKQNPAIIMRNAERYAIENKFPPAISELMERKSEARSDNVLEEIEKWEREAVGYNPRG